MRHYDYENDDYEPRLKVEFAPNHRLGYMPYPELADDNGKGANALYAKLDARYDRAEYRRRVALIMPHLTMRQHEIFNLMAAGYRQEQIAVEFKITQQTVAILEARLLKKIKKVLEKCL